MTLRPIRLATAGLFVAWMVHDLEELATMSDSSRAHMSRLPDWIPVPQSVRQRGLSARYVATAIAALGVVVAPEFVVEEAIVHFEFWRTGLAPG